MTDADTSSVEHFDLTFSNEAADNYILHLEIGTASIKACWYHHTKNLVTGFADYPNRGSDWNQTINALLSEHPFIRSNFSQIIVGLKSENYSLVPTDIKLELGRKSFEMTNPINEEDDVLHYQCIAINATIFYTANHELLKVMNEMFQHVRFVPHTAIMIEALNNQVKRKSIQNLCNMHVWEGHLDIQFYQEGKLILANSFAQTSAEDIAYYLLYSADVCNMSPEEDELLVSGEIEIGDETWKLLSNYWKHVAKAGAMPNVDISNQLADRSTSQFDYLTNSLLCAL